MELPVPVIKFIKKLKINSAEYVFAIATLAGSPHRGFTSIKKMLKKKG